jgi:hypothetical protein
MSQEWEIGKGKIKIFLTTDLISRAEALGRRENIFRRD